MSADLTHSQRAEIAGEQAEAALKDLVQERYTKFMDALLANTLAGTDLESRLKEMIEGEILHNAFKDSARIRMLGNAGLSSPFGENSYGHLGLELWTKFGLSPSMTPEQVTAVNDDNWSYIRNYLIRSAFMEKSERFVQIKPYP